MLDVLLGPSNRYITIKHRHYKESRWFWFLCFFKRNASGCDPIFISGGCYSLSRRFHWPKTHTQPHTHMHRNTTRVQQLSVCWAMMSRAHFLLHTDAMSHVSSWPCQHPSQGSSTSTRGGDDEVIIQRRSKYILKNLKSYIPVIAVTIYAHTPASSQVLQLCKRFLLPFIFNSS